MAAYAKRVAGLRTGPHSRSSFDIQFAECRIEVRPSIDSALWFGQCVDDVDRGLHVDWLSFQDVGLISPLADCIE